MAATEPNGSCYQKKHAWASHSEKQKLEQCHTGWPLPKQMARDMKKETPGQATGKSKTNDYQNLKAVG
jgi:hypothetical protein